METETRKEESSQYMTSEIQKYKKKVSKQKCKCACTGVILGFFMAAFAAVGALLWIGMFGPPAQCIVDLA